MLIINKITYLSIKLFIYKALHLNLCGKAQGQSYVDIKTWGQFARLTRIGTLVSAGC